MSLMREKDVWRKACSSTAATPPADKDSDATHTVSVETRTHPACWDCGFLFLAGRIGNWIDLFVTRTLEEADE